MTHVIHGLPFWWKVTHHDPVREADDEEAPPIDDGAMERYLAAVRAFAEEAGVTELEVRALGPGRHRVREGQRLTVAEATEVVRELLGAAYECKLESPADDFAFHVYEGLAVWVGASVPCPEAAASADRRPLFVGRTESPHLPDPGSPDAPPDKPGVRSVHAWADLRQVTEELRRIRPLGADETRAIVDAVAERFVADRSAPAWHGALRDGLTVTTHGHAGAFPWTALIEETLPPRDAYVLLVGDDHRDPRGAVEGTVQALAGVLHLAAPFDWIITTRDADLALFDTADRDLVLIEPHRESPPTDMWSFAEAASEIDLLSRMAAATLRHADATGRDRTQALRELIDERAVPARLARARRYLGDVLARGLLRPEREALQQRIATAPVAPPGDAEGTDAIFAAAQIVHRLVETQEPWEATPDRLADRLAAAHELLQRAR